MKRKIEWTRVKHDANGNSRHVCHFLDLLTSADHKGWTVSLDDRYKLALERARKFGGRKFHNKRFGGGIVFQVSAGCLDDLSARIFALTEQSDFVAMQRRAVAVVSFHPCTGAPNSQNRYKVVIRDFPSKSYPAFIAENAGIHGQDQAEYFAEMRIKELGLDWTFASAGTMPDGSAVFTAK